MIYISTRQLSKHARQLSNFYDRAKERHAINHLDRQIYLEGHKPRGVSDRVWQNAILTVVEPKEAIVNARTQPVIWNLIAERWEKWKEWQSYQYTYNLWEKLRIAATDSDSATLNLLVRAYGWQWESAGSISQTDEGWTYKPGRATAIAKDTLKTIILKHLDIAIDIDEEVAR